jgi:hypothetical protein
MIKKICIIKLFITFNFLVLTFNLSRAQSYNEILGRPTDKSITLNVLFDSQCEVYFQYGTVSGNYDVTTSATTSVLGMPVVTKFDNLQTNTKYFYRTCYRKVGNSTFINGAEHFFHTQRSIGSTFTFTIEADEHLNDKKGVRSLYTICLDNQLKDNPDFMIDLGDIFGNDNNPATTTKADMKFYHYDYIEYLGKLCHSVPLLLCIGNHEGENSYYLSQADTANLGFWATEWRKFYYSNPYPDGFYTGNTNQENYGIGYPENYYSWVWGDALFVVLDVYRYESNKNAKPQGWDWSLGLEQYTWLKNTLENSTAKYKFVFAHHTRGQGRGGINTAKYFEWGGYEQNGSTNSFSTNRAGWAKPIHQLFVDNKVNIFFQGHDHLFAHEVLDNVVYQDVPMSCDSTYKIGVLANADAYVSDTLDGSGYLRVTVSPQDVRVDFVRAYLPADTLSGIHHNKEVPFSYLVGDTSTAMNELPATSYELNAKFYPNPANNRITIETNDEEESMIYEVLLINTLGQNILQTKSKFIDISTIPNGMYFLNIKTKKYELNKKIIINHN